MAAVTNIGSPAVAIPLSNLVYEPISVSNESFIISVKVEPVPERATVLRLVKTYHQDRLNSDTLLKSCKRV